MGTKRVGLARVEALIENLSRDLALGGSTLSHKREVVLGGSGGTTTLTAAQSGALCVFDNTATTTFVLPSPAVGMHFTFVSAVTALADHVIQAPTNDAGFLGGVTMTQLTSTAADQCDSFSAATDGNNDFITMNGSTSGGVAGCIIHVYCISSTDGAKAWLAQGNLIATGAMETPFGDVQL